MKPLRYHPGVQRDINEAMRFYIENAPESVVSRFWNELSEVFDRIRKEPESHHFDSCGLRRCNLRKFPYHILFQDLDDRVRVQVVRHNSRNPGYGTKRKRG